MSVNSNSGAFFWPPQTLYAYGIVIHSGQTPIHIKINIKFFKMSVTSWMKNLVLANSTGRLVRVFIIAQTSPNTSATDTKWLRSQNTASITAQY